jgi:hypothetical protein
VSWSERQGRRQRATEAYWDDFGGPHLAAANTHSGHALEQAIHAATRVRITDEMLERIPATRSDAYDLACELFEAAGFEVEE